MPELQFTSHADLAIDINHDILRDEYLDVMTFQANDRLLFTEIFGPLIGLKEEWLAQGATPAELDFSAFHYRSPRRAMLPVRTGWLGGPAPEVLEDTAEHSIVRDSMGRRMKLCKGVATLPLPLDYPVKTMDDWLRLKPHYEFCAERLATGWEAAARQAQANGAALLVGIPGGFDEPRQLLGEEELCVAYYTRPELIHDILETIGDMLLRVLEPVTAVLTIDELTVHEDMAGKSGPLAGPRQVEEFIRPYYRKVWDFLQERGTRLFSQDSDGDMNAVIPAFLDAGLNVMFPMEPAANMDIVALRQHYGQQLAFIGGLDKHVLRKSKAEIDAELEYKVPAMARTGGCVLGLDHRIPNGTPLEHYRYYLNKLREIIARENA